MPGCSWGGWGAREALGGALGSPGGRGEPSESTCGKHAALQKHWSCNINYRFLFGAGEGTGEGRSGYGGGGLREEGCERRVRRRETIHTRRRGNIYVLYSSRHVHVGATDRGAPVGCAGGSGAVNGSYVVCGCFVIVFFRGVELPSPLLVRRTDSPAYPPVERGCLGAPTGAPDSPVL